MATTVTTRAGKGSPLTNTEVDSNFTALRDAIDGHTAASDPHSQYLLASSRGAANGVASLDASSRILVGQLPNSGASAGSYGSASLIPVVTVDAAGRITAISTASITVPSGSLTFTGDVTGSGSTGSSTALTLAGSGVTAGTYNDSATAVRPFTVDSKGRITSIGTAVTIAPAWSSITSKPTTLSGYGITDAASSTHTHAASDITSGVLATSRLGTGTASSSTYLRGDGTWVALSVGNTFDLSVDVTYNEYTDDYASLQMTAIGVKVSAYDFSATTFRDFLIGNPDNGATQVGIAGATTIGNTGSTTTINGSSISMSSTPTVGGTAVSLSNHSHTSFTGLTLSGPTLNDGYTEEVFAVSGTTPALSPTNGSIQTWTLSGNSTPTAGTWAAGQSMTLMIDDGSSFTVTWTSLAVTWKTGVGTAPSLNTTGYTAIQLWKVGTVIYGARVGDA